MTWKMENVFGEKVNKKKREAVKKKICHQNEDGPK